MASRKKTKSPPPVGKVRVKILPKDPLVARRDGMWPEEIDFACASVGSGPTGPDAVVVDYNVDLDTRFAPAQWIPSRRAFRGIAQLSNPKILDDFRFHQVNVWAIVERTLAMIEDKYLLGRAIPWASQLGRLILLPHAGYDENAFYDRDTGALHLCYFEGANGKPIYTCLSHDIITHELGHAVLDGLKPYYNEVTSAQTAGFHEYFGDAVAMMASLRNRAIAKIVIKGAPQRLSPRNVVSAIASEFGGALRALPDQDYLRGAWNNVKMDDVLGTYQEHDWSEVLTGIYYDLLEYLYPKSLRDVKKEGTASAGAGANEYYAMRALSRAATITSGVMFRGLDYCPPVDLRYDEYARAVLRADEVAYPLDDIGIRATLQRLFKRRGLKPKTNTSRRDEIQRALRGADIGAVASTPADAYRFLDAHRTLFRIPYGANIFVPSVYRTNKHAKSGYQPPKEHIIEFVWSEDVKLTGRQFGPLAGEMLPLWCGGTIVFDSNDNFLHLSLVAPSAGRRKELKDYTAYLVKSGSISIADGVQGIGAPATDGTRIRATIAGGRVKLARNAAMRHARH